MKQQQSTTPKISLTDNQNSYFAVLFTIGYFVAALIGIYHHEMWRDEIQAWLIASHSSSLFDLSYNARYEGHPILWHTILFLLAKLNLPIGSMKFIHVLIGTGTIYLISKFSPFSWLEKIGLALGNYLLYEYLIISRAYGLGVFLIILIVVLLNKPIKNVLYISLSLALLSNTSIFGLIAALGIGFSVLIYIYPQLKEYVHNRKKLILVIFSVLIGILGFILSVIQINPPSDVSMPFEYTFNFDKDRLLETIQVFTQSYFIRTSSIWVGIITFSLIIISLRKNLFSLLLYLVPSIGILMFLYITGKNDLRYLGVFPILFFSSLWIFHQNDVSNICLFSSINKKQPLLTKLIFLLFSVIIIFQAVAGVNRYNTDIEKRYSNIEVTGAYLEKNKLNRWPIAGEIDYMITPFVAFNNKKPVYVTRRDEECYYGIWDNRRFQNKKNLFLTLTEKIATYDHFEKMILISHYPYMINVNNKSQVLTHGRISNDLTIKMIKKFDENSIRKDEKFYIYEITKNQL